MPPKAPRPAGWEPDRAGLDDLRGQRQSEVDLHQNTLRAQAQRRLRRQRLVARLHDLGPRAVFEAIDEIDRHRAFGDDLDRRLQRYADADPELLRAFGADHFAPSPTRQIWGRP